MLTYADKEKALRDLENINKRKDEKIFYDYCRAIFGSTDKIPVILDILENVKKCMIPTSSGEGSIELAARGIDVYTYDISIPSYYAQQLRIAATKMLEYEEFLSFYYMFESNEILAEKYYEKLRTALEPRAQFLLDKMFSSMRGVEILDKLYDILRKSPDFLDNPGEYMDMVQYMYSVNTEEGFYKAKNADLQSKIHYAQFDILDLAKSDYKDERDFDMVFFSNILYFLPVEKKKAFIKMLKSFYLKYLKVGGSLVNYFHSMDGLHRHLEFSESDIEYDNIRNEEIGQLYDLSEEFYQIGLGLNGMGLYQNDIVHLIRKVR